MKIPVSRKTGVPTVSATQLRTYGAGGFRLAEHELSRGCPALYKAKYVDRVVEEGDSYPLIYGRLIHRALHLIETQGLAPFDALEAAFEPSMPPELLAEAQQDLTAYLQQQSSPMDLFQVVGAEMDMEHQLYVDDDFGPIGYRGIIDWIGVDDQGVLQVVDYKTNRRPVTFEDVLGDVQLKGYGWLAREVFAAAGGGRRPSVVVHLDAIKWHRVEVRFDDVDLQAWHAWAVAVTRKILRDETAVPVLNPSCHLCPVNADCPEFTALPTTGKGLVASQPEDLPGLLKWRDNANAVRLLLVKAVAQVDDKLAAAAREQGSLRLGGAMFVVEDQWETRIDLRALHAALGERFYSVVTASKTKVEKLTADWDPSSVAPVQAAITRAVKGTKVARRKAGA